MPTKENLYNLLTTILDNKEVVMFLGEETCREENPWEPHYGLAALSVALIGKSNARLFLTTCYADLMRRAFEDLEGNSVRPFNTVEMSLSHQGKDASNADDGVDVKGHLNRGRPVILKIPANPGCQSAKFGKNDMMFGAALDSRLLKWMKKTMIFIGYSFSDEPLAKFLMTACTPAPVFLVNTSDKIPPPIRGLERVRIINSRFSDFVSDLLSLIMEKYPEIMEAVNGILEFLNTAPENPASTYMANASEFEDNPYADFNGKEMNHAPSRLEISQDQSPLIRRILILSANPKGTARLRLDKEVSEIDEGLRRAKLRDRFVIESRWAVRFRDIRRALLDHEPHIVHFSGHGSDDGLFVEDEMGLSVHLSSNALSSLFKLFSNEVECVILNACHSASQADAISKHVKHVIGMNKEIMDKASIEFSVGFYDALGAGKSVEEAFEFGRNAIEMNWPDQLVHLIPVLSESL